LRGFHLTAFTYPPDPAVYIFFREKTFGDIELPL
jgi:hypothetical protein